MPERPNLLFIITDQQRVDSLACYGNDWIEAPNLNALANRSFVFEHAYVTQPVCTPARSSILTGTYPHANGLTRNNLALSPETKSIAECVSPQYRRIYFGKWHLGHEASAQHGFEEWLSTAHLPAGAESEYHRFLREQGVELPEHVVRPGGDGAASEQAVAQANLPEHLTQAAFVGDRTAAWIRDHGRNPSRPFVLFANFFEPHPPYSGPLGDRYDPEALPVGPAFLRHPAGASLFNRARSDFYMAGVHRKDSVAGCDGHDLATEQGWRNLRAQYFANITLLDRAVGKILRALEEAGLAGNTIIAFTSDHGEMAGDHGLLEKRAFYEEASKVPMLITAPQLSNAQTRVGGNFSHIDLVPTLLDLLGEPVPKGLPGQSRAEALRGNASLSGNEVVVQWNGRGDRDLGTPTINQMIALSRRCLVSSDRWKLVLCEVDPATGLPGDQDELFDLNSDPHELHNRFDDPDQASRIRDMKERLVAWQHATGDTVELGA